jgi:hypothetical protein
LIKNSQTIHHGVLEQFAMDLGARKTTTKNNALLLSWLLLRFWMIPRAESRSNSPLLDESQS